MSTVDPLLGDRRRRQYVPLSTHFAHGETGRRILAEWGPEGLLAWVCLLAAAKRSPEQGSFEWTSEPEAWYLLGLPGHRPEWTFEAFAKWLGRYKLANTTRSGEVRKTSITAWKAWNKTIERDHEAARKRRKRAENTPDNTPDDIPPIPRTEGEVEVDTPLPPVQENGRRPGGARRRRGGAPSDMPPSDPMQTLPIGCEHCSLRFPDTPAAQEHTLHVHRHRLDPDTARELELAVYGDDNP